MAQDLVPPGDVPPDDPYEIIALEVLQGIIASDTLDFRTALDRLSTAYQATLSHLANVAEGQSADAARFEALQRIIEFLHTLFQAHSFRVERNPGKAREAYVLAQQKATFILNNNVDQVFAPVVEKLSQPIPVLLPLCSAAENLVRGNIDAARIDVQRTEVTLFVWFDRIGVDTNRPLLAEIAGDLDALPAEALIVPIGSGCDFFVVSSIIKLQYCMQTQKYNEELESSRRINALFDVFSAHIAKLVATLPMLKRFYVTVQCTSALARGCMMIVEGGAAAEDGNFEIAYVRASEARKQLNEATKKI